MGGVEAVSEGGRERKGVCGVCLLVGWLLNVPATD